MYENLAPFFEHQRPVTGTLREYPTEFGNLRYRRYRPSLLPKPNINMRSFYMSMNVSIVNFYMGEYLRAKYPHIGFFRVLMWNLNNDREFCFPDFDRGNEFNGNLITFFHIDVQNDPYLDCHALLCYYDGRGRFIFYDSNGMFKPDDYGERVRSIFGLFISYINKKYPTKKYIFNTFNGPNIQSAEKKNAIELGFEGKWPSFCFVFVFLTIDLMVENHRFTFEEVQFTIQKMNKDNGLLSVILREHLMYIINLVFKMCYFAVEVLGIKHLYFTDFASRFVVKCALWYSSERDCSLLHDYYKDPVAFVAPLKAQLKTKTDPSLESKLQPADEHWLRISLNEQATLGVPLRKFSVILRLLKDAKEATIDDRKYSRYLIK